MTKEEKQQIYDMSVLRTKPYQTITLHRARNDGKFKYRIKTLNEKLKKYQMKTFHEKSKY